MNATVTNLPVAQQYDPSEIMSQVLLAGDLSKLTHEERSSYFLKTCQSLGLNPLTKPLDYIRLSGREVLYATKGCADQLRKINRISLEITDRKITGDLLVVTVRATTPDGRVDEDMGVIPVKGLVGEALSNAMLKAVTKAKRRVTLSICGLGMLDESEVRSAVEAEALAGPVSPEPKPKQQAIAAPKVAPEPPPPPATFAVTVPYGGEPVLFPRNRGGAKEALGEISKMFNDKYFDIVTLNLPILDQIATRFPDLAEEISELRADAAEKLRPADEPDPNAEPDGFVKDFLGDDDDVFPGDLPSREIHDS